MNLDQISAWIGQHWLLLFAIYYVFSAAISSMPQPAPSSSALYTWAFGFGHSIAGSVGALIKTRFPQAEVMVQTANPTPEGGVKVTTVSTTTDVPKTGQA